MRDYFADIIKKTRETGATRGNKPLDANVFKVSRVLKTVSPCNNIREDRGDNEKMSPPVSLNNFKGETPKGSERLTSPLPSLVSPEEIRFEFEERAAIFEYEGGFTRKEAEERAYRQTLKEFLSQQYPGTLAEFESIIYQSAIN